MSENIKLVDILGLNKKKPNHFERPMNFGYNKAIDDLSQYEINSEKIRKIMCQAETKYWKLEYPRPIREVFIADYLVIKSSKWLVKKG
jgi:hypothetical protein